jgi:hypothetical protein
MSQQKKIAPRPLLVTWAPAATALVLIPLIKPAWPKAMLALWETAAQFAMLVYSA